MPLVAVKNLNFEYPKKKVLKDVNFEISEGSVTALVGPNGAGKTTLLRCLVNLEAPVSGTVTINGINVHDEPRKAHQCAGYLSDFFGVYDDLTVRQCLTYMGWCHKLEAKSLYRKVEALAEEVDITSYIDAKAGTLSRGYRQRLGIGMALVHEPKFLLLDEPASGMDPEARIKFSELMIRLRNRGITMIVSSHILAELEDYCTDMLVLREGEIKSHVILSQHIANQEMVIQIGVAGDSDAYIDLVKKYDGVSGIKKLDGHLVCGFRGDHQKQSAFLHHLINQAVPVYSFTPMQKTLKSAYMDLAEKTETEVK